MPGVVWALVVAAVATLIDYLAPAAFASPGPAVIALLLGIGVAATWPPPERAKSGLSWSGSRLLQAAIVLLGLTVPVSAVVQVGPRALPVVATAVLTAFAIAAVLGRVLGVSADLRTLIGAGTGICGASAIAAVSGVLRPRPADVSYALSTVVLMNLVAIASLPALARVLDLSDEGFGAWVGSSVNDTSAVVALASGWSSTALGVAVVVKLTRLLALVPVTLLLGWRHRAHSGAEPRARLVPPFLMLFVFTVALAATGVIPAAVGSAAGVVVEVLITVALAAVGCSTRVREIVTAGWAPLLLGALVWVGVAAATLGMLSVVGLA